MSRVAVPERFAGHGLRAICWKARRRNGPAGALRGAARCLRPRLLAGSATALLLFTNAALGLTMPIPVAVAGGTSASGSARPQVAVAGSAASAIATGNFHTCAIVTGGTVECWGNNADGQLGDGTNTDSSRPVAVVGLGSTATAITTGDDFSCALLTGGTVECWGDNDARELGNGSSTPSPTPVAVSGLSGVTAIAAGDFHTCYAMITVGRDANTWRPHL